MKIKLMLITHDLAIGGLQQVVVTICKCVNREKFDISVLCLRNLGEFVPEVEKLGIKVHYLTPKKNRTDYFSFFKVAKLLRQEKIDVIHTHNTQPLFDGTLGSLLSNVKTIIHTDHARSFPDKRRYMFAEWLMSHFVYRMVGVSEHTSANLVKFEKISPKKILTIENGIDGSLYAIKIDRPKKRKELGIRSGGPVIGLGVRLTEQKGITYLLQAMPKIIQSDPDITLVIAGDGTLKNALQNEAKQLGVENNVLFLGKRLDIPELLKLYDIYVLPSLWEGMPMVLLEAMAACCPIVATNVGGVANVIENKQTGLLIPPRNPEILSNAIASLLRDEKLREKLAQNALRKFEEQYSAKVMTKQYEKLYMHNKYK